MDHETDDHPEGFAREDAHPRAAAALTDDFFWDTADACGPFGSDAGRDVPALFRAFRDEHEGEGTPELLAQLMTRWEVADADWDATTEADVARAGADDEYGLLARDEIILALAFAEFIEEGAIDPEIQRRALIATVRQALPLVLAPWGPRMLERAKKLDRMRELLSAPRRPGVPN